MNQQTPTNNGNDQRSRWIKGLAVSDEYRMSDMFTPAVMLDAGLPLVLFTVVYAISGQNLNFSLWVALGASVLITIIRILRHERLQNAIAGFLGVGIAAFLAHRTGRAEDVFLPGLLINVAYGLAYLVSILVRWPLLGVVVGFVTGQGTSWRQDPVLLRAYTKASALWVLMFALRLAVQGPLYFAGDEHLGWLAGARLAMSWPLFLLVAYLSWAIIRPAYRAHTAKLAESESETSDDGSSDPHKS